MSSAGSFSLHAWFSRSARLSQRHQPRHAFHAHGHQSGGDGAIAVRMGFVVDLGKQMMQRAFEQQMQAVEESGGIDVAVGLGLLDQLECLVAGGAHGDADGLAHGGSSVREGNPSPSRVREGDG